VHTAADVCVALAPMVSEAADEVALALALTEAGPLSSKELGHVPHTRETGPWSCGEVCLRASGGCGGLPGTV
jgi:hypothetical protein